MLSRQSKTVQWLTTWLCCADTVPDTGFAGLTNGAAQFPSHPEYGTVGSPSKPGPANPSNACPTGGGLSSLNPQQTAAPTTPASATFGRKMQVIYLGSCRCLPAGRDAQDMPSFPRSCLASLVVWKGRCGSQARLQDEGFEELGVIAGHWVK